MAELQRYFIDFHNNIRLEPYDENEQLREKRDVLLKELKANLPKGVPAFESFNQGSYAMNTGTVPKDGNYDIDVGLIFSCHKNAFPDSVELKRHVYTALNRGTRTVRIRRPCVTVEYLLDGQVDYHVDLAVYVQRADGVGLDLALGREDSGASARIWQQNDPQRLIELIANRFSGDEASQMRRVIRYLKRWRDHCFPQGKGPISVALTVAAYRWFVPHIDMFTKKPIDAHALKALVNAVLSQFQWTGGGQGQLVERLAVASPVVTYPNLLAEVSQSDMDTLKARLQTLAGKLQQAIDEPRPEVACALLVSQFGGDFPTPTPGQTARKTNPPYVHTGQSA
jgi:cyclic GMP-AMP synthase DncV-like protein